MRQLNESFLEEILLELRGSLDLLRLVSLVQLESVAFVRLQLVPRRMHSRQVRALHQMRVLREDQPLPLQL